MIDLKQVFRGHENVSIEVKAADKGVPSSVWDTYSSFANTFGGTIILGIGEKDKEVSSSRSSKSAADCSRYLEHAQQQTEDQHKHPT